MVDDDRFERRSVLKTSGAAVAAATGVTGLASAVIPEPEFGDGDCVSPTEEVRPYLEACPPSNRDTSNTLNPNAEYTVLDYCWYDAGYDYYYELEYNVGWVAEKKLDSC